MKSLISLVVLFIFTGSLTAQDVPGLYPFTSTRAVALSDVEGKTLEELKIMRNEVFARYGHTFKSPDLQKHFGAQPWYQSIGDASAKLTPLEKQNVDFIKKWEGRLATTSDFDSFFEIFQKAVRNNDAGSLYDVTDVSYFSRLEDLKEALTRERSDLVSAFDDVPYKFLEDEYRLAFGEFYNGVQYRFMIFKKIGCCWYFQSFQRAG